MFQVFRLGVRVWYIEKAKPPRQLWAVEDQLSGFAHVFDGAADRWDNPRPVGERQSAAALSRWAWSGARQVAYL